MPKILEAATSEPRSEYIKLALACPGETAESKKKTGTDLEVCS